MTRPEKRLCGHCGKRRQLKNVTVEYKGETRKIDICRPCGQAFKEKLRQARA